MGGKEPPIAIPTLDFGVVVNENIDELTIGHEIFCDGEIRDRTTIPVKMLVRRYHLKTMAEPPEFARYDFKKLLLPKQSFSWKPLSSEGAIHEGKRVRG